MFFKKKDFVPLNPFLLHVYSQGSAAAADTDDVHRIHKIVITSSLSVWFLGVWNEHHIVDVERERNPIFKLPMSFQCYQYERNENLKLFTEFSKTN